MSSRKNGKRVRPVKRDPMAVQLESSLYRQRRVPGRTKDEPRKRKHKHKARDER